MGIEAVNFYAVGAAVIVNMAVGGLWYSNLLFGKAWMELVGFTEEDITNPGRAMGFAAALSVLIALMMALVMSWLGPPAAGQSPSLFGMGVGLLLWTGFSGPTLIMHLIFHQAPAKQFLINGGNYFVAYVLMGTVIGTIQYM